MSRREGLRGVGGGTVGDTCTVGFVMSITLKNKIEFYLFLGICCNMYENSIK